MYLIVRQDRSDPVPESFCVVMEYGVYELVNDHIVHHEGGSQDEPPGETERARGTAGAPACAGRCDPHSFVLKIILAGEELYTLRQNLLCLFAIPAFKCGCRIVLVRECQFEFPIVEQ